jgi:hypothetical protein
MQTIELLPINLMWRFQMPTAHSLYLHFCIPSYGFTEPISICLAAGLNFRENFVALKINSIQ